MKTNLFQSCDHCWVFQIRWHFECSILTKSSFRIWNSSTGIPSPPLALFIVMFPNAHLTSHSRIPGSRWVITPSWLSGSLRSFLYSSSVYSCHLFLMSSVSVRSLPLPVIYFRFSFILYIFYYFSDVMLFEVCTSFCSFILSHIFAYPFIISSFASMFILYFPIFFFVTLLVL